MLETYQTRCETVPQRCFYTIADGQLFRVKHVIAYLEANRQVGTTPLDRLILIGHFQAAALISSSTNEDITFKDRLEQIQVRRFVVEL